MKNITYLEVMGVTDKITQQECLAAMQQYGDNHWWEPDSDERALAYHQLNEDVLLVDTSRFHKALEVLLNRLVFMDELRTSNRVRINPEAEYAWKQVQL